MSATITFVGRLGRDPETRATSAGDVTTLACAVDSGYGDKKTTAWYRVSIWGKPGAAAQAQLVKGQRVFVTGQLAPREHEGKLHLDVRCSEWEHVDRREQQGAATVASGGYGKR